MHLPAALLLLTASVPLAFAAPKITVPAAGASVPGGTAFTITWVEDGVAPAIVDLVAYQVFLYSGSNAAPQQLYALPLPGAVFTTGNTVTGTVPINIGGPGTGAYFLGIQSTAKAGGTVTTYSSRFTLTGMTGTFSGAVLAALKGVTGTAGPPTLNQLSANIPAAANPVAADFDTPYNLQTGPIKYAPMQPVPGNKITATNTKPLWPTSSVVLASTFMPIPSQSTTFTQAGTFKVESHPNTAAAASQPTNDMQRFLNRWKD